jgi:hypothetical protein
VYNNYPNIGVKIYLQSHQVTEVAEGLWHLHDFGVVHGDIRAVRVITISVSIELKEVPQFR